MSSPSLTVQNSFAPVGFTSFIPPYIDVYLRMTKTVRLDDEVHEELRQYMERRSLSSFGEAVDDAVERAEGAVDESGWVVSTRDVLGGEPRIRGTRIGILNLLHWHDEEGMSPGEIAERYDAPAEGVEAALRWGEKSPEEVRYLEVANEVQEEVS